MKPKTIQISAKCSDLCSIYLYGEDTNQIGSGHNGYVPNWISGSGGDYVTLSIDLETGRILDWKEPSEDQLDETFHFLPEEPE